jgi:hypothetical protein
MLRGGVHKPNGSQVARRLLPTDDLDRITGQERAAKQELNIADADHTAGKTSFGPQSSSPATATRRT